MVAMVMNILRRHTIIIMGLCPAIVLCAVLATWSEFANAWYGSSAKLNERRVSFYLFSGYAVLEVSEPLAFPVYGGYYIFARNEYNRISIDDFRQSSSILGVSLATLPTPAIDLTSTSKRYKTYLAHYFSINLWYTMVAIAVLMAGAIVVKNRKNKRV